MVVRRFRSLAHHSLVQMKRCVFAARHAMNHIVNHPLKNGYSVECVKNGGTRTVHLMRAAISFAICAELRDMNGILAHTNWKLAATLGQVSALK